MPLVPSPVTDYATEKRPSKLSKCSRQPNSFQSIIPVFCDEGVSHTVADIIIAEPNEFSDVHGMMGMFHLVKILLKCHRARRYRRGSGIEDALIETGVFGKLTLKTILEGCHCVRSFRGIMMVSDLISSLACEFFWQDVEVQSITLCWHVEEMYKGPFVRKTDQLKISKCLQIYLQNFNINLTSVAQNQRCANTYKHSNT